MNSQVTFSTPKIKARVNEVRFVANGNAVKCFLTVKMDRDNDPYYKLAYVAADAFGARFATNSGNYGHKAPIEIATGNPNMIPRLEHYTYVGFVRLKDGDEVDIEKAKSIAYKKAYRQFIGFYKTNYMKLYERMLAYAEDVWQEQIAQLIERYEEVDEEITDLVED